MKGDKTKQIPNKYQLITRGSEEILFTQKQEDIDDFAERYYGHYVINLTKKEIERIMNGEKFASSISQEYTVELKIIDDDKKGKNMIDGDLFKIAERDLFYVKYFLNKTDKEFDDYRYNYVAFYLEQALEKCIKSISIGNDMGAINDIDVLILKAKEMNIDLHLSIGLMNNAKIISLWGEDALYELQHKVDKEKVKEVLPYVEEYLKMISKSIFKRDLNL